MLSLVACGDDDYILVGPKMQPVDLVIEGVENVTYEEDVHGGGVYNFSIPAEGLNFTVAGVGKWEFDYLSRPHEVLIDNVVQQTLTDKVEPYVIKASVYSWGSIEYIVKARERCKTAFEIFENTSSEDRIILIRLGGFPLGGSGLYITQKGKAAG